MKRPEIMGIVNVTPDSFSGDGRMAQEAVAHAESLVQAGAEILDIGAESTRPGAVLLSAEEEWRRLEPVLSGITAQPWRKNLRLSVDTRHAPTAAHALALGVEMINDVSAFADPAMAELLATQICDVVVMHALGVPADPTKTFPADCDVVVEILEWKKQITATAAEYGIAPERLIYDPGIGFGKTAEQSLALILRAEELVQSGGRWLFGHSRKSFLKLFTDQTGATRDDVTLAVSAQLIQANVHYLRVHEAKCHVALRGLLCM